jgi:hypothetical protein
MKKELIAFVLLLITITGFSQETTTEKKKKDWSNVNLNNRTKDHLMFQIGTVNWTQAPDSIDTKGLSRTFNFAFMFDFVFKTDPRFSVGMGVGVASDNVFFNSDAGRDLNITRSSGFSFGRNTGADSTIRYKSIKLHNAFLEAPVELRFMLKPETPNKSLKLALGVTVGTMITAVDKTRFDRDAAGNGPYNSKVKDRKNFNALRIAPTFRIGYGNIGLFAQYQLNDFIKEGLGPSQIRPFNFGLTISGL